MLAMISLNKMDARVTYCAKREQIPMNPSCSRDSLAAARMMAFPVQRSLAPTRHMTSRSVSKFYHWKIKDEGNDSF